MKLAMPDDSTVALIEIGAIWGQIGLGYVSRGSLSA